MWGSSSSHFTSWYPEREPAPGARDRDIVRAHVTGLGLEEQVNMAGGGHRASEA